MAVSPDERGHMLTGLLRRAERIEQIRFTLTLDHDQYSRVQGVLGDLAGDRHDLIQVRPGDSVSVTYDFALEYFNVVKQLRALGALLDDPDVIVAVELRERRGLEILLVELVDAIRDVQAKL